MAHGIIVVFGVIFVLVSRVLYFAAGHNLSEDEDDALAYFISAIIVDVGSTAAVVLSILDYYSVINI